MMRLVRREKPAAEKPLTDDEISAALVEDNKNPGERFLNPPHAPGPVEPPAEPPGEAEADTAIPDETAGDNEAVAQAMQQQAEADDSKNALLRQFQAVQRAERMQQRMAAAPRVPHSLQDVIEIWKAQGLTDAEGQFLLDNPNFAMNPKVLGHAANLVHAQGMERDSDEYFSAIKETFGRLIDERAQKKAKKAAKHAEPVPEFFQPAPPQPEPEPAASGASIYSAPVSRQTGGGGSHMPSPNSVRLTTAEREAAAMSGISETEYARNKLLMLQRQARGETQK